MPVPLVLYIATGSVWRWHPDNVTPGRISTSALCYVSSCGLLVLQVGPIYMSSLEPPRIPI